MYGDAERVSGLALEIALDALPREDRQLYENFYRKRLCVRDIAQDSGEPEGTVKFRLFALRGRLRKRLL